MGPHAHPRSTYRGSVASPPATTRSRERPLRRSPAPGLVRQGPAAGLDVPAPCPERQPAAGRATTLAPARRATEGA